MNKPDVIEIVDDRLEKRFESYAQSQIKLHQEYHDKLLAAVESQIKTTVNGKIDTLNEKTDNQDKVLEEVKSLLEERKFAIKLWSFIKFIGGVLVAIGSGIVLYKNIKP